MGIKRIDGKTSERLTFTGTILTILTGFYLLSYHGYLLFHSLIEIITVVICFTLFIFTWNTRVYLSNNYLKFIGIGYAFIALIDLIHTLAYKGMNVFPGYDTNLPTQLWIVARYLQAATLCAAPFLLERRLNDLAIVAGYAIAVTVLVTLVFSGGFPDCYIEGRGLTPFKIISEYVITVILLAAAYLLYRKRRHFNEKVYLFSVSSIACLVVSEILFTAYLGVYDVANMIGHFSKLAAFYLIYRAILVTGLREPFDLIFRELRQAEEALRKTQDELERQVKERTAELETKNQELKEEITERKQAEEALRESEAKYVDLYENASDMYASVNAETALVEQCNNTLADTLGYSKEDIIGRPIFQLYHPDYMEEAKDAFTLFVHTGEVRDKELQLRRRDGSGLDVSLNVTAFRNKEGKILYSRSILRDITEHKRHRAINESRLRLMQYAVSHSLDELLEETLNEAEKLTHSLIGFYHFVDEDQESLTLQSWSARTKGEFCKAGGKGLHYAIAAAGVWVDCVYQRRPVVHNDYASLQHRKGMPEGHAKVIRELVVPVIRGQKIKAILGVGNKPADYTEKDMEVISLLADLAWEIAERKLAEEALHRLNRELQAISNCNQTLLRATDEQTLLNDICRIICEEAGYRMAWVGYAEHDDAKTVLPVARAGVEDGYLSAANITWADEERGRGPTGTAIRTGKSVCIQDFMNEPKVTLWRERALIRGYRSCIALPLRDEQSRTFGALNIYSTEPNIFTPGEAWLMEELAGDLAFGITVLRAQVEHKRAEEALQRSNDLLRAIIGAAPTAIIGLDLEGRVQLVWNPAAEKMLGWSAQEAMGRFLPSVPVDKEEEFLRFREWIRSGKKLEGVEVRRRKRDGTPIDYSIYASPLHGPEGQITGNIAVLVDITERKRSEEEREELQAQLLQAQKMESVGRLAGGVAHDFNNMLGVILGHVEMVLERVDPSQPLYINLEEIRKAAKHSANLTQQLLAFARKQIVSPKVLDLNETVEGMLKILRRLIGEDIDLVWLPKADLWSVKVDPSQVGQILANLCVNARDAISGVGRVTIKTCAMTFDEAYCASHPGFIPGEYVMLRVSDDGCGMDKNIMDQLFEPFFTTKEGGKGTGLGLATVYGIVKQNNGFINVCSEPRKGASFEIYLPRHAGKPEQIQEKGQAVTVGGDHETILLVEDEPEMLKIIMLILERFGYNVLTANTPGEALRLSEERPGRIHLLMTDVIMPEMNGRDLAKKLLTQYPDMKCLFMSGYTADIIAHHGVLDKGVHFIHKPFSIQDLTSKVREVLSDRERGIKQ